MNYNLTEKLTFNANPTIKINDTILEIDASAKTALMLLDIIENESEISAVRKSADLIIKNKKDLDALDLSLEDYATVISTAVSLVMGTNPDEPVGE